MSAADRLAELRAKHAAELELAEAELELAAAKEDPSVSAEAYNAVKARVRALRQAQRDARAGSATVSPAPVTGSASVPMGLPVVSSDEAVS